MYRDWTGADATALREALRWTTDEFARRLGVAPRSVNNWSSNPHVVPRAAVQDKLSALLERAPAVAQARFDARDGASTGPAEQRLRVAIAVVLNGPHVLLVRRRETERDLAWQFPAGIVKPGGSSTDVAARETLAETGVLCEPRERIGSRLHPVTGVTCDYHLCEFLGGAADNLDPAENSGVTWAPRAGVTRYVPRANVFPPILAILEAPNDRAVAR